MFKKINYRLLPETIPGKIVLMESHWGALLCPTASKALGVLSRLGFWPPILLCPHHCHGQEDFNTIYVLLGMKAIKMARNNFLLSLKIILKTTRHGKETWAFSAFRGAFHGGAPKMKLSLAS